jgi:hypothetical protein
LTERTVKAGDGFRIWASSLARILPDSLIFVNDKSLIGGNLGERFNLPGRPTDF